MLRQGQALGRARAVRIAHLHRRNNQATAGAGALYAPHRRRLHALLASGVPPGGRLCVLGAGNGNDLELEALADTFSEVHLVDIDPAALTRARSRAGARARSRLHLHAPVDVGAVAEAVAGHASDARAEPLARAMAHRLPGPFDVVLSDCVLTQLYWSCWKAIGDGPALERALRTTLDVHLGAVAALTAPGGRAVLATDAISSASYPLDELFDEREGATLLAELTRREALFSGTSPALLRETLRRVIPEIERPRLEAPWLWRVEEGRTVLVYALSFTRPLGGTGATSR